MKVRTVDVFSIALVVLSILLPAVVYQRLPDPVPVHWNAAGAADGFAPKPWGPFLLPMVVAAMYLLLTCVGRLSARATSIDRFRRVYDIMQVVILGFLAVVNLFVVLAGIDSSVAIDRAIPAATGLLFVVLGNYMGKVTRNSVVGIRTPWTLASDEVWLRTNRLGGRLLVVAGAALVIVGVVRGGILVVVTAVVAAAVIPVIYSYVVHRGLAGR
jgi:uncharacterized membrane protein